LLPHRVKNVRIIEGKEYEPVIMDNFILVQMREELFPMKGNRGGPIAIRGDFRKGEVFKVVFDAEKI
jgi:hypothetical protein